MGSSIFGSRSGIWRSRRRICTGEARRPAGGGWRGPLALTTAGRTARLQASCGPNRRPGLDSAVAASAWRPGAGRRLVARWSRRAGSARGSANARRSEAGPTARVQPTCRQLVGRPSSDGLPVVSPGASSRAPKPSAARRPGPTPATTGGWASSLRCSARLRACRAVKINLDAYARPAAPWCTHAAERTAWHGRLLSPPELSSRSGQTHASPQPIALGERTAAELAACPDEPSARASISRECRGGPRSRSAVALWAPALAGRKRFAKLGPSSKLEGVLGT